MGDIFGMVGTLAFVFMLLPQVQENYQNASTEGLSFGLVLLWHLSGMLALAFFITQGDYVVALSMLALNIFSVVLEGQHIGYTRVAAQREAAQKMVPEFGKTRSHAASLSLQTSEESESMEDHESVMSFLNRGEDLPVHPWSTIALASVGFGAGNFVFVSSSMLLFEVYPACAAILGSGFSSALLAAGFLPQYYVFFSTWSTQGYSFGVTAIDLLGSVSNTLSEIIKAHGVFDMKLIWIILPFLIIIAMQTGMVAFAMVIMASERWYREPLDQKYGGTEILKVESNPAGEPTRSDFSGLGA